MPPVSAAGVEIKSLENARKSKTSEEQKTLTWAIAAVIFGLAVVLIIKSGILKKPGVTETILTEPITPAATQLIDTARESAGDTATARSTDTTEEVAMDSATKASNDSTKDAANDIAISPTTDAPNDTPNDGETETPADAVITGPATESVTELATNGDPASPEGSLQQTPFEPAAQSTLAKPEPGLYIELKRLPTIGEAHQWQKLLESKGFTVSVQVASINGKQFHEVLVGPFTTIPEAKSAGVRLQQLGEIDGSVSRMRTIF